MLCAAGFHRLFRKVMLATTTLLESSGTYAGSVYLSARKLIRSIDDEEEGQLSLAAVATTSRPKQPYYDVGHR
jgi:hypothetical protein